MENGLHDLQPKIIVLEGKCQKRHIIAKIGAETENCAFSSFSSYYFNKNANNHTLYIR